MSVVITLSGGHVDITAAETGSRWLLIINALLIVLYLWRAANRESTGKQSVTEQMWGSVAPIFWVGIVVLGIIIPIAIAFSSYFAGEASASLLVVGVACEVIGG